MTPRISRQNMNILYVIHDFQLRGVVLNLLSPLCLSSGTDYKQCTCVCVLHQAHLSFADKEKEERGRCAKEENGNDNKPAEFVDSNLTCIRYYRRRLKNQR